MCVCDHPTDSVELGYFICTHRMISPNEFFSSIGEDEEDPVRIKRLVEKITTKITRSRRQAAKVPANKKQRRK